VSPTAFAGLVEQYAGLLDRALERREYKVDHPISEQLRAMGDQLGFLRAGPRNVVSIYSAALKARSAGAAAPKVHAYVEEGRPMALELIGHLVTYYRLRSPPRRPEEVARLARARARRPRPGEADMQKYLLKLYVTGQTPRSLQAITNLRRICEEELRGEYEMVVIDVLGRPQLAEDEKILATPTVIKELPTPIRRIIGDLSDSERVLLGLDLRAYSLP
jgi:circadian clock protein KaiB